MFVIADEIHAEHLAEFESFDAAMKQLREWSTVPWDQPPNRAPCMGWRDCGRMYEIIDYDDTKRQSRVLGHLPVLEVSKSGVKWLLSDD